MHLGEWIHLPVTLRMSRTFCFAVQIFEMYTNWIVILQPGRPSHAQAPLVASQPQAEKSKGQEQAPAAGLVTGDEASHPASSHGPASKPPQQ
jgi:hypothetical protein